jgi:16S rRNA (cytosine967-C5)-methyltransferase
MRYIQQHIGNILESFKGEMPLGNFLKFYFKKHPILGSRDRKIISEMAYCYYRCAKGLNPIQLSLSEKINAALLLSDSNLPVLQKVLPEHLQSFYGKSYKDNLNALTLQGISFNLKKLCSEDIELSKGIDKQNWLASMVQRPRLFIRVRKTYLHEVQSLLGKAAIPFEQLDDTCIALANGTSIEKVLHQKMYRIQDASSQKTAQYFNIKDEESCWDCCSGAGGKALLIKETAKHAHLCVSDIRKSILDNLAERFQLYGHQVPERLLLSVADVAQTKSILGKRKFDHIIADVPCSGSGTWARTPEQLYFFENAQINDFAERQKNIALNAIQYLKPGATFIYITCSVFSAENEAVVSEINKLHPEIKLIEQHLINGISMGADSMFIAVMQLNG